jgi:tRNA pseudouridine55 synthase
VRKLTRVRKSGHAGALDPLASGVLILGLGKATKLTESLMDLAKVYQATARLDVTNPGYDLEMELQDVLVDQPPTRELVLQAASRLEGRVLQAPPTYSSVKIGGVPAYKLAKKNKISSLEPKPVNIYWIVVRRYAWPELNFDVGCGRGTYIRSLIRDWGAALGTGGCLTSLRRLSIGPFTVERAHTADDVEQRPLDELLIPLDRAREQIAEARSQVPPRPA